MEKNISLDDYLNTLNLSQRQVHDAIRDLIQSVYPEVRETLFTRHPYFYLAQHEHIKFHFRPSIMLSFFGTHVNVFTMVNRFYEDRLTVYRFTEKHTMQIEINQELETETLKHLFLDALL